MPLSVRERYEKMREQNNISLNIDKLIANFDKMRHEVGWTVAAVEVSVIEAGEESLGFKG